MIDHILGRPSPSLRRTQILLVISFWLWRLYKGDGARARPSSTRLAGARPSARVGGVRPPSSPKAKRSWLLRLWITLVGRRAVRWMAQINDTLKNFTPYQLILGTLTVIYALRHASDIMGLGVPEPLASLYTRSFYRATYINTALDAGFASAMAMRPKWIRDLASVAFSAYYMVYVAEGDEVLRRFRALCTVEMLRTTWEKTNNPYIRMITYFHRPSIPIFREVLIPRPTTSSRSHLPPVKGLLCFSGTAEQLAKATQLVVDFPGGGFVAMGPACHEERLRSWAKRTGKPVLGIDYGKAPEYPYPWAIEEGFDAYRTLMESRGSDLGIRSGKLGIVLTGDSAGGNICATIMLRILEHSTPVPRPISIILAYPALDFNFTSWMSPANLRVLRTEQSETHMPGVIHGKDHLSHKSPLSVTNDVAERNGRRQRQQSWGQTIGNKVVELALSPVTEKNSQLGVTSPNSRWKPSLPRSMSTKLATWLTTEPEKEGVMVSEGSASEADESDDDADVRTVKAFDRRREADKSIRERIKTPKEERRIELPPLATHATEVTASPGVEATGDGQVVKRKKKAPIGTRLTMTSRVGYFQDKIISPSMMRAMAILYIGPSRNPDFETDYYISPILSPPHLLAHFPPVYLICGERDPFVDDTIIFAGKIREAKRRRRAQAETSASARYGEGLRMTTASKTTETPDHIIRETDEDWVQMRIIEGWGHGFMQMSALMREVDSVMTEMADWIDESFEKAELVKRDAKELEVVRNATGRFVHPLATGEGFMSPEDQLPPPTSTHVKPVNSYGSTSSRHDLEHADLGAPVKNASNVHLDDDEGTITFTPRTKRRPPPLSKFNPVPRQRSKESLEMQRSFSAPKFDVDETGSSGEAVLLQTPTSGINYLPGIMDGTPKGSGAFAFFNSSASSASSSKPPLPASGAGASLFAPRRPSWNNAKSNPLVAAAVAGARAASPALAAAGLVPEKVGDVSEIELMRRRRMEAVFGMGETDSPVVSDDEEE